MDLVQLVLDQPAHVLWFLGGVLFLLTGATVGEPSISALGLAAIITAIAALTVVALSQQIFIWGLLSIALAVLMRGMVPRVSKGLRRSTYAEVSELIPQGGVGHVAYEGSLWRARCQDDEVAIAIGQRVLVVGREGTTLIVIPEHFPEQLL